MSVYPVLSPLVVKKQERFHIVRSLGRLAELWMNPSDAIREEAVKALIVSTGFTRDMIEKAIYSAFSEATEEKLLDFLAAEPAFQQANAEVPPRVLHVLAGNVFTSWLPGAITTLLLGAACDLKPSSREPLFPSLWKRSLEKVDKTLAEKVQVVLWKESFASSYKTVVAYGSDETLAHLRAKLQAKVRLIGYGHKLSAGILSKEALHARHRPALLSALLDDLQPFDLEGCLSPKMLYLEGENGTLLDPILDGLKAVPACKTFHTPQEVIADLKTFQPHVSAVGFAGTREQAKALWRSLEPLGVSRLCSMGKMQRPPLTWRNGGISLATELTKPFTF